MNDINASSLFHYTRSYESLIRILKKGLRMSFAFEEFSPQIISNFKYPYIPPSSDQEYRNTGIAIPMISFCDIPITRSVAHINKYGKYMIGLDKKHTSEIYNLTLNPVIYINSENLNNVFNDISFIYGESVRKISDCVVECRNENDLEIFYKKTDPILDRIFNCRFIIGFVKPYSSEKNKSCYYDEREWRAIRPGHCFSDDESNWEVGIKLEDYERNKEKMNRSLEKSNDNFMRFSNIFSQVINHIVVNSEEEIPKIIETIMRSKTIFGTKDFTKEDKLLLVSKVTSFERIEKDY